MKFVVKNQPQISTNFTRFFLCGFLHTYLITSVEKILGIDQALLSNREWNQKQKHKKQPWGKAWNASHLAVLLCALRHWNQVSMPPTTQSLRRPRQLGLRWCCGVADSSICLKSDMLQHQRQVRSTGIAKRLFFMFFVSVPQYLSTEPFNPLKSYLRRFFDFLGGDRALGENSEHSEHSDAATPNSLTPNP